MSIFLKIFLSTSIAIITFIVLFTNYIIKIQNNELMSMLNKKIKYQNTIATNTISQLLFDLNKEVIVKNLNSLYEDISIAKIELIDYSDIINYTLDNKKDRKNLILSNLELKKNKEVLGELNIYYTKDIIYQYLEEYKINILKLSLALTLIFLVILFYFTRKYTSSLIKLTNATKQITNGDLDTKIEINAKNEIGQLANEFDTMRLTLKNRITEIKEQLKFQQVLMESVNMPIYIQDENNYFIDCNQAFCDFFGRKKKRIVGSHISAILQGENLKIQKEVNKLLMSQKEKSFTTIAKFTNIYQDARDLVVYKNLYLNKKTQNKLIIGTFFDITEINEAKERIQKFNEKLKLKVAERTEELEESNHELETTILNLKETQNKLIESEKMSSLGLLVAGVAHEINTPVGIALTGISHFIENLSKINKDFEEEKITENDFKDFLDDSSEISNLINNNLLRTANLVKSFKNVAVDQTSEELRVINLKSYINEVLFSMSNLTKNTEINIVLNCSDSLNIKTYPGALSQILTNLVINSLTHGFKEIEHGIIGINVFKEETKYKLVYTDSGKGIKKENLTKIFDPFFTTNREHGGTGLGLNIIYNIVTNILDGSILCESNENEGVKFTITFKEKES